MKSLILLNPAIGGLFNLISVMRFILYALFCTSIFSQSVQSSFSSDKKRTVFIEYAGSISTVFSPIEINQNNNVLLTSYLIAGNDDLPLSPVLIGKIKISCFSGKFN